LKEHQKTQNVIAANTKYDPRFGEKQCYPLLRIRMANIGPTLEVWGCKPSTKQL